MAFNFFGTFSTAQLESLKAFSRIQKLDLNIRKGWLTKKRYAVGIFITEYDGDRPSSFMANEGSYASKLLQAYRILGGCPERDMLLRTIDKPVYLTTGTAIRTDNNAMVTGGFSDIYSNGRRNRGTQRFDRDLGLKVDKLKEWQKDVIKAKRERLEFKIKRALDYSDQLLNEIKIIEKTLDGVIGGFDDQITDIELQAMKEGTSNITDDIDDIFGLYIGKQMDATFKDSIDHAKQNNERGLV